MRIVINGLIAAVACVLPCVAAEAENVAKSAPMSGAAVQIDGVGFTVADLQRKSTGALFQARNALYQAERQAADELIAEYLLSREAKARGVTVDELLNRDVYSRLSEPSEESLRVYYEGVETNEPYEAVRGKILDAIRQRRMAKAKTAYIQSLRSRATISVHLSPPRVDLAIENAPLRGASSAVVTLVEYADYECPYCQQIQPAVARLVAEYRDKLAFVFKDLPLPMHANAQKAAEAARCAAVQGKYWEYHDRLFETRKYDLGGLKDHARALKLDAAAFDKCLDSGAQSEAIKQHVTEAQAIRLPGTPAFFVNGRFVSGDGVDYEALRKVVDEEIAAASRVATARSERP